MDDKLVTRWYNKAFSANAEGHDMMRVDVQSMISLTSALTTAQARIATLETGRHADLPDGYSVDVDQFDCITLYQQGNVVQHIFKGDNLHTFFAFLLAIDADAAAREIAPPANPLHLSSADGAKETGNE